MCIKKKKIRQQERVNGCHRRSSLSEKGQRGSRRCQSGQRGGDRGDTGRAPRWHLHSRNQQQRRNDTQAALLLMRKTRRQTWAQKQAGIHMLAVRDTCKLKRTRSEHTDVFKSPLVKTSLNAAFSLCWQTAGQRLQRRSTVTFRTDRWQPLRWLTACPWDF